MNLFLTILSYLSCIICLGYIIVSSIVFKQVLLSISDTYYLWQKKGKDLANLFKAWCWLTSFSLLPILDYYSTTNKELVYVGLAIFGLMFVGLFPHFKGNQETQHVIGAIMCASMIIIWNLLTGAYLIVIICALLGAICIFLRKESTTFWLELVALVATYTNIFIR
jgi:hypothetical protein